jgi:diguanylate cyclase (GGDEF)-like protein
MEATGSWLCPTSLDRARVIEASARVRKARMLAALATGAVMLALAPRFGWGTMALFGLVAANLAAVDPLLARSARPERVAARAFLVTLLAIGLGIALSGGVHSPILSWVLIPVALAANRFRRQVVMAAAALGALTLVAAVLAADPSLRHFAPEPLLAVLALLVSLTAGMTALMGAELANREQAVLDPLTGLLNRKALESRTAELEQQARLTGAEICLILCDLDGFKRINDGYGHQRGDAVLQDATKELRGALRSFELIYRIGGEEFLVLIPGIDLDSGVEVAERLRRAVAHSRPGGLHLTMSLGVAARAGEHACYEELFEAADRALYEAKRAGRDRVVAANATLWALAEHAPAPPPRSEPLPEAAAP